MPKVKLTTSRVRYDATHPSVYVSEPSGTVVDVSEREASNLIESGQATVVEKSKQVVTPKAKSETPKAPAAAAKKAKAVQKKKAAASK